MKRNKLTVLAALGTVWLAVASGACAQSIGVNFVSGGSGVDNSDADSLGAAELAGGPGFAEMNWNSIGRYGSVAATVLVDSNGATTPLFISIGIRSVVGRPAPTDRVLLASCLCLFDNADSKQRECHGALWVHRDKVADIVKSKTEGQNRAMHEQPQTTWRQSDHLSDQYQ